MKNFSLNLLELDKLNFIKEIGQGAFGTVY